VVVVVVVVVPYEDCTAVAMRTWDSCCCNRTVAAAVIVVVGIVVVVMMMVGSCTVEVGHYAAVSLRQRLVDHVVAETMVVSAGVVVVEQMGYHHLGRTCIGKIDDSDSSVMIVQEDVWMTVVVVASRIGRMPSYGWEQQQ
jgi:hypothetical protein